MSSQPEYEWLSACHDAPIETITGEEGTTHARCTKCGKPCNIYDNLTAKAMEPVARQIAEKLSNPDPLREKIQNIIQLWRPVFYKTGPTHHDNQALLEDLEYLCRQEYERGRREGAIEELDRIEEAAMEHGERMAILLEEEALSEVFYRRVAQLRNQEKGEDGDAAN